MTGVQTCALPISNGTGTQIWAGSSYASCQVGSCNSSFHVESNQCLSNTKSCAITSGTGTQLWSGSIYGSCQVAGCNASFHIENNQCISNVKSCAMTNGSGTQTWTGSIYGSCQVASCYASFHSESNQCQADSKSCPMANGTGVQNWTGSSYGTCLPASCNASFHSETGQCTANSRACAVPNGNGNQTWNGSGYAPCQPTACNTSYHIENNHCVSDTRSCGITNGNGMQAWNGSGYGACQISACNDGYHTEAGQCLSNSQSCNGWGGINGTQSWNGSGYGVCMVCSYGQSRSCVTVNASSGSQVCAADGSAYSTCSVGCGPGVWSTCWGGYHQCNAAGTDFGACGSCKSGDTEPCSTGIQATPNGQHACVVNNSSGSYFSSTCTPISSGSPGFCSPGAKMGKCLTSAKSEFISIGTYSDYTYDNTTKQYTNYGKQFCNSAGTGLTGICKICEPGETLEVAINFRGLVGQAANIICIADGADFSEPRIGIGPCNPGEYFVGHANVNAGSSGVLSVKACEGGVFGSWLVGKCKPGHVHHCGGGLFRRCDSSLNWGACSKL